MIPTTTGAATSVGLVLPQLQGKLDGLAIRVPTPNVSVVDFVAEVERETSKGEVNEAFRKAAEGTLRGILASTEAPLVSVDYNKNPHSAIVDATLTNVIDKRLVKVIAWYDNEWGYSCRVCDLIGYISQP
jgi:glyceraldehyde 3-phosphate dehydrogenase